MEQILLGLWVGKVAFWEATRAGAGSIHCPGDAHRASGGFCSPCGHPQRPGTRSRNPGTSFSPTLLVERAADRDRNNVLMQEERRDMGKPRLSLSGADWEHQESLQQQLLAMRVPAQPPQRGTVLLPSHRPHARGGVSYSNKNAPFHLGDCSQFEMKTFVPEIGVIPGIATPRLCFQLICSSRHAFPSALAQRREIWRWLCAEMPAEMCTVRNEEKAAPAHSSPPAAGTGSGWGARGSSGTAGGDVVGVRPAPSWERGGLK